jgi:hypothetical protein
MSAPIKLGRVPSRKTVANSRAQGNPIDLGVRLSEWLHPGEPGGRFAIDKDG